MKLSHKQWGGTANRLQNSRFFDYFQDRELQRQSLVVGAREKK